MKGTRSRAVAATIAAALFLSASAQAAPSVSAQSAIVMDAASGVALYEKDADRESLIASTTKIMTGLLAAESGKLDMRVRIPAEAAGIEGSSLYLKPGEVLTVRELLYGLMLHSGNDAAVALAIATRGGVAEFVDAMNEKARELGLHATHFANPNGLDDAGNYATARDLSRLACAALENETFRQVVSTKSIKISNRCLRNHNKLLWRYEGAVGVKTGFTKKAGRLLVSAAERGGRRLVAVTINAPSDWNDHAAMLDYGFSGLTQQTLLTAGQVLGGAAVVGGTQETAACVSAEAVSYPLFVGETPEIRLCLPRFVFAPVRAGETAGKAQVLIGGKVVAQTTLYWAENIELAPEKSPGFWQRMFGGNGYARTTTAKGDGRLWRVLAPTG